MSQSRVYESDQVSAGVGPREVHGSFSDRSDQVIPSKLLGAKYRILRKLGEGGFGRVYLAYNEPRQTICALKCIRSDLSLHQAYRDRFLRECRAWISLGDHPYLVSAQWVEEFNGELFLQMDYVPPDAHQRTTLADHLRYGQPPSLQTIACWAVQFCHAMDHAAKCGMQCHHDIKPANILIDPDNTEVRISDFGLARVIGDATRPNEANRVGRCGTPGYAAPEIFSGADGTHLSDQFGFGMVLWELVSGQRIPLREFGARGQLRWDSAARWQKSRPALHTGPLAHVIETCLQPDPANRFPGFAELRACLEGLFPEAADSARLRLHQPPPDALTLSNRGASFHAVGLYQQALECYDQALALEPNHIKALNNRAYTLIKMSRYEQALDCCRRAISMDATYITAHVTAAIALAGLALYSQALESCSHALRLDDSLASAWTQRGNVFLAMNAPSHALTDFDRSLRLRSDQPAGWTGRATALVILKRIPEAIHCFRQACRFDPQSAENWNNLGNLLVAVGAFPDSIEAFRRAVLANPDHATAWGNLGNALQQSGDWAGAHHSYVRALEIEPNRGIIWLNHGYLELRRGAWSQALRCFQKAETTGADPATAKLGAGLALEKMGHRDDAKTVLVAAIHLAPNNADARTALERLNRP